jgi:hypothetical protein
VDGDQIFLSSHNDVSSVIAGVGIAASYELGQGWIKDWGVPFCDGKCDILESGYDGSFGMPYVLTAGDARRHADLWSDLTEEMRPRDSKAWMTEMFSGVIAARRLGIRMNVVRMMLSSVEEGWSEPWEQVRSWHDSPAGMGVWVSHYCQAYMIGNFRWHKGDNYQTDIRSCNRSAIYFPSPNEEDLAEIQHARDGSLDFKNGTGDSVKLSRQVWMLDHTLEPVRRAIDAYYDEFCKQSTEQRL